MKVQKTPSKSAKQVKRQWYLIDAKDCVLGRVASEAAQRLIGKQKTDYVPYLDDGDHVVIINADKYIVTGNKMEDKFYYRHSGYPGGLKKAPLKDLRARKPKDVLRFAVKGMLPKNRLQASQLKRLHLVLGDSHPYDPSLLQIVSVKE